MKIGIIGLPSCGKTTVFNALTGGHAEVHAFVGGTQAEANIGIVSVPDERQEWLARLYKPRKTTYATVEVVDVAGLVPGQSHKDGFSPQLIAHLRQVDALVHVVRGFTDPCVPHSAGSVDALRDAELVELELILADLAVVERRLEKIDQDIQRKKGLERTECEAEKKLLLNFKDKLGSGEPLRQIQLSADEAKLIRGYTFTSGKPLLLVANVDEVDIGKADTVTISRLSQFGQVKGAPLLSLCAKTEMEIAQLEESERAEFLLAIGILEPSRDTLVKESYKALDVISFFTTGEDEVKAWTITRGTHAQEAARKIHSDIARGFIRAEVVPFDALKECGTWHAAKDKGLVRLEGKDYVVADGDCINFRFAV